MLVDKNIQLSLDLYEQAALLGIEKAQIQFLNTFGKLTTVNNSFISFFCDLWRNAISGDAVSCLKVAREYEKHKDISILRIKILFL